MALLDLTHGGAGNNGSIASAFASLAASWQRYSHYRRTVRELRALDDDRLADVGLNRSAIYDVARKAVGATAG